MDKIMIFGGTGFIGLSLAKHLRQKGMQPILVARHTPNPSIDFPFVHWDSQSVGKWAEMLSEAVAIVNLAGKTVDCVKTPANCDLILRSRVDATKTIGKALRHAHHLPKVWIQMSTAHIYGDPPEQVCTESSSTGYGLAPFVGKAWEAAYETSLPQEMRGVILRTSFVIGKNGGALSSLKRIVQLRLGGRVGTGKQGMSWIHEFDLNQMIYQAIIDEQFKGVYVASSPQPVSNTTFMHTLRKKMGVRIGISSPAWLTIIGAKYIFQTDPELALYGRYVRSEKLDKEGFTFAFPTLDHALEDLL